MKYLFIFTLIVYLSQCLLSHAQAPIPLDSENEPRVKTSLSISYDWVANRVTFEADAVPYPMMLSVLATMAKRKLELRDVPDAAYSGKVEDGDPAEILKDMLETPFLKVWEMNGIIFVEKASNR